MAFLHYGMLVIDIGIKFIPLRTPGGELIPGSGLFVQIKKTTESSAPKVSDREVRETSQHQQIGGQEIEIVAADIENRSIDDDTLLTEESFESESSYCERRVNFKEDGSSRRRCSSSPSSLKYTDGHFRGSMQLKVIAEVNEDPEDK